MQGRCCVQPTEYSVLRSAYCLLPAACCLLLTACCLLPAACCLLPAACCLLAIPTAAAGEELPEVVAVEGEPFRADLAAIDPGWQLTFDSDGNRREMPAGDLVRWGTFAETARGPVIVLADGGMIVADVLQADKERVTTDSEQFGQVELSAELIAGVVFHPPTRSSRRDLLFDRLSRAGGDSDRIILTNGDEITGSFQGLQEDAVLVDADVGPVKVGIERVSALVFNPALLHRADHQGPRAWAGFRDGSRLVATRLILEADSLEITVAGGLTLKTAAEKLVSLQPLGGRVTYLSDLKPAGYRHLPFLELHWPYRTDRNVLGGRLRSGGKLYLKGLGVHSAARLTYQLSQPYKRFQASLGVDDHTGGRGSVRFRVFVDGRQKHASQTVRGGDPPLSVSVDLAGAKRLDLVVDYADRADELDHADWLDARLVH